MVPKLLYIDLPGEVETEPDWDAVAIDYATCTVCGGPASPAYLTDTGVRCWRCEGAEFCHLCGQTVDAGGFFGATGATCWACTNTAVQVLITIGA